MAGLSSASLTGHGVDTRASLVHALSGHLYAEISLTFIPSMMAKSFPSREAPTPVWLQLRDCDLFCKYTNAGGATYAMAN